ncbi:MAG TPA: hypothetical protein VGF13_21365, partial [Verrucomicrobiae bacterium]
MPSTFTGGIGGGRTKYESHPPASACVGDVGYQTCRHERFAREPSLETAFAYEAIYKRTASELFSGLYQKIEQEVAARAKILSERTKGSKSNRSTLNKRQILSGLALA